LSVGFVSITKCPELGNEFELKLQTKAQAHILRDTEEKNRFTKFIITSRNQMLK